MEVLTELLQRLRSANLTAKPSKCCIGYGQIECLGHMIAKDRLSPHPHKVKAIENAPRPETKRQVKSFLGLVGFITNLSQISLILLLH